MWTDNKSVTEIDYGSSGLSNELLLSSQVLLDDGKRWHSGSESNELGGPFYKAGK